MVKFLVCIALVCAVLVSVNGRPGQGWGGSSGHGGSGGQGGPGGHGGPGGYGGPGGHGGPGGNGTNNPWVAQLCANASVAQAFLAQTQALISTLQSNGSFAATLAKRANQIAYLTNSTDTALLGSNCTQYFSGLQSAKALDWAAAGAQQSYDQTAGRLFKAIIQSVLGGSDSSSGSD